MSSCFGISFGFPEACFLIYWLIVVVIIFIEYLLVDLYNAFVGQWLLALVVLPFLILQTARPLGTRIALAVAATAIFGTLMVLVLKMIKSKETRKLNLLRGRQS